MKKTLCLLIFFMLVGCSFGGFKPPPSYHLWRTGSKFYSPKDGHWLGEYDFFDQREKDMRSCGMDPVTGESGVLKVNLCLEQKGWYLAQGPVCEEADVWNKSECIKWRAKHSKPNAKPWGCQDNDPRYPICWQMGIIAKPR
ncbi:hypothetical protein [Rodentibacter rarus]|uniref:hypothetical protein n=1 Tax=Rodentibacter rarus TaxID=1908260 RepID=UPI002118B3E9|nr:hypothetical protein [Rodentibacter rarus]